MSAAQTFRTSSDHQMVVRVLGDDGPAVAQWNIGSASDDRVRADLRTAIVLVGVTVLGLVEASDRKAVLARLIRTYPWNKRTGDIAGAPAVPILWDQNVWQLEGWAPMLAVPRAWVGPAGAGPEWAKPKIVTSVRLRHRDSAVPVRFLCTHLIPSVTRGRLPIRERLARRRHYRRHVRFLARVVRRTDSAVVVFVDANAPRLFPLLNPLHRAGLRGWTRAGTHGDRAIDHVLTRKAKT